MSRRVDQAPASVDALLPSLGALSVSRVSTPKQAPIAAGNTPKRGREDGKETNVKETKRTLGLHKQDPETNENAVWFDENFCLDQNVLKRLVYAQNSEWAQFYPPASPEEKPERYNYENWTSFFPKGDIKVSNPHWLRTAPDSPVWPEERRRHDSLALARAAFANMIPGYLKDLTGNDKDTKEAERDTSLKTLIETVTSDANNTESPSIEKSRATIDAMFRQNGVFGVNNRKRVAFKLPPGWMMMYIPRSVDTIQKYIDRHKKPGTFSDPVYVGPQYESWSNKVEGTEFYSAILQKSPVHAWLVYLMYQKSSKTHDAGERDGRRRKQADNPDPTTVTPPPSGSMDELWKMFQKATGSS